jgi:hypothetical protein
MPTLRLKWPVTVENMPRFADDIAQTAQRVSGAVLDYSPASLTDVDIELAGFAAEGVAAESIGETARMVSLAIHQAIKATRPNARR